MRLLLDENLSPAQAAALREQGHDAISVLDLGLAGAPDEAIRATSIAQNRVLLTLDADFANILRFPPAETPGVIRLKVSPPSEAAVRDQIHRTMALLQDIRMDGRLAVAHKDVIRIRGG